VIPAVVHLVGNFVLASLIVGCVLMITSTHLICRRATRGTGPTLVAMTS
jgi:hypothetical protein